MKSVLIHVTAQKMLTAGLVTIVGFVHAAKVIQETHMDTDAP